MTQYFSNDFDFEDWKADAPPLPVPPPTTTVPRRPSASTLEFVECLVNKSAEERELGDEVAHWSKFFASHHSGKFFQPRKYLSVEFADYLSEEKTMVEIGAGHGCSLFQLAEAFPGMRFTATDYCAEALEILRGNECFDEGRMAMVQWDVTTPPPLTLMAPPQYSLALSVFALSAVHPVHHEASLRNMRELLLPGGYVLFRDYGVYDLTMYRHSACLAHMLFERADHTLAYYFTAEYLSELVARCQLEIIELNYATVFLKNRKSKVTGRRVFVHGVFRKPTA